jgi:hypothetical protein
MPGTNCSAAAFVRAVRLLLLCKRHDHSRAAKLLGGSSLAEMHHFAGNHKYSSSEPPKCTVRSNIKLASAVRNCESRAVGTGRIWVRPPLHSRVSWTLLVGPLPLLLRLPRYRHHRPCRNHRHCSRHYRHCRHYRRCHHQLQHRRCRDRAILSPPAPLAKFSLSANSARWVAVRPLVSSSLPAHSTFASLPLPSSLSLWTPHACTCSVYCERRLTHTRAGSSVCRA